MVVALLILATNAVKGWIFTCFTASLIVSAAIMNQIFEFLTADVGYSILFYRWTRQSEVSFQFLYPFDYLIEII